MPVTVKEQTHFIATCPRCDSLLGCAIEQGAHGLWSVIDEHLMTAHPESAQSHAAPAYFNSGDANAR